MGIRLALGASPASLLGMIVGQGMKLTAVGLVIGLALALGAFGSIGAMRSIAAWHLAAGSADVRGRAGQRWR